MIPILIIGIGVFYFSGKTGEELVSYGYGFKSNKYLSQAKGEIADFGLLDHQGNFRSLYRDSNALAIVIISQGNDCPIIQRYSSIINEIKNKYAPKNIVFYFLNSNRQDSREAIIKEAKKYNLSIPILMDPSQVVAESLGITRTSEAVVISPKDWKILYKGAISDRMDYGIDKQVARNNYLNTVLDAIVENKTISLEKVVDAKGCLISFNKPVSLSYEKVIAPIIINKCLNCHTESSGYLPYFDNYQKVKGWTAMSKETIVTDRMPPWSSDPLYGKYANNISLTPEEKRVLIKWIDIGAPKDGTNDPLVLANSNIKTKKLSLKNIYPLHVGEMRADNKIPPSGLIEYKYVQLGGAIPFDMWVTGVETISTTPQLLHHANLMITSKDLSFYQQLMKDNGAINEKERSKNLDGDLPIYTLATINRYDQVHSPDNLIRFLIWAPSRPQPLFFGKYGYIFVPKGSYMIEEAHYMGSGREEFERNRVALYGFLTKPKEGQQIKSLSINNYNFTILPNKKENIVKTPEYKINKNIHLLSFNGHLHMRGTSIKLEVILPDNKTKTIVSIPNYYYGWGTGTSLVPIDPIAIKAGSSLRAICNYDNSEQNPYNPDSTKTVHFGQRVDRSEMCQFNIAATYDDPKDHGFIHPGYDMGISE